MITLADYVKDWPEKYPDEYRDGDIENNAKFLLHQVNTFLEMIGMPEVHAITSGWRPREYNATIPNAARNSYHIAGRAVDIADPTGELIKKIAPRATERRAMQLWMESPLRTRGWIHLDNGFRKDNETRIFQP
jgi:hypothetical protein